MIQGPPKLSPVSTSVSMYALRRHSEGPIVNQSFHSLVDYSAETLIGTTEDSLERLLYAPSPSGAVGFSTADTSNSSEITTGFGFYGSTVFCYVDNAINTRWFAVPTNEDGLWNRSWNSTSDSAIAVALRSIAPTS
jgi:hypothetical protein